MKLSSYIHGICLKLSLLLAAGSKDDSLSALGADIRTQL